MSLVPPQFPVGSFRATLDVSEDKRAQWIDNIAQLPAQMSDTVAGLSESELNLTYRNWTIRQIVHHVADSHVNSYIRFKWALTEQTPHIKSYNEGAWSQLREACDGSIVPSLLLLEGLHSRWCQLLKYMTPAQFDREFFHPESRETISLIAATEYYSWHGKHHTGQILWLLNLHGKK